MSCVCQLLNKRIYDDDDMIIQVTKFRLLLTRKLKLHTFALACEPKISNTRGTNCIVAHL